MTKIRDLKEIRNVLTNNYHGMNFASNDMYVRGDKLYINEDGHITIYNYPVNEYFEAFDTAINLTTLPFKEFIDFNLPIGNTIQIN